MVLIFEEAEVGHFLEDFPFLLRRLSPANDHIRVEF
jgi:hypothetical protein